jgi:hypothetical protein
MHVDWAVFAAKVDSNPDGTVNLHSVGTPTVTFGSLPNEIPALTFIVMAIFANSDRDAAYPMQASLIGADGKTMLLHEVSVKRRHMAGEYMPFTFTNIPVVCPGIYRARFEAGGQRRECPFHVALAVALAESEASNQLPPPEQDHSQTESGT